MARVSYELFSSCKNIKTIIPPFTALNPPKDTAEEEKLFVVAHVGTEKRASITKEMWHEINTVVLSLLVMKGFGRRPRRPSLGQLTLHVLA